MKKPVVIWIIAALFLVCSFPLFAEGNIGAGVCGIVIAAALAAFGYVKMQKGQAAAEEAKQAEAATLEEEERKSDYDTRHGLIEVSVAGVTFENDDGTERQRILAKLYKENEGGGVEGVLEKYEYKGKPAIRVIVEGKCVGVIRNTDLPELLPVVDRVEFVAVYVDRFKDDGETIYRADLRIEYAK